MKTHKSLASLTAASAFALAIHAAQPAPLLAQAAATTCWDFADLSQTERFGIGEVFVAPTATINFIEYLLNGNWVTNTAAIAYANNSAIAGGPNPELRTYLINAQVIPNTPLDRVTWKFGFTNSLDGSVANLGVNGQMVEIDGAIADLHGRILGHPALGRVLVTVALAEASPERGTVTLQAISGKIHRFAVGGRQDFVDDICMTP